MLLAVAPTQVGLPVLAWASPHHQTNTSWPNHQRNWDLEKRRPQCWKKHVQWVCSQTKRCLWQAVTGGKKQEGRGEGQRWEGEEEKQSFSDGNRSTLKDKEVTVLDGVDMRAVMNEWIKKTFVKLVEYWALVVEMNERHRSCPQGDSSLGESGK